MKTVIETADPVEMDDHTALLLGKMLLRMKEQFLSTPEQKQKYEEWHLKEYGCLPNGGI